MKVEQFLRKGVEDPKIRHHSNCNQSLVDLSKKVKNLKKMRRMKMMSMERKRIKIISTMMASKVTRSSTTTMRWKIVMENLSPDMD
jgi:hypothetical protein